MAELNTRIIEKDIIPGAVVELSPLVQRITAPNPSPMTGPGTNTYLVGRESVSVIDPGPAIESHIDAILQAGAGKIEQIIVTHTHSDHSPAAKPLADLCGAPLVGSVLEDDGFQDKTFVPDVTLHSNQKISAENYTLEAIATPGHVGNHFCFFLHEENVLFTGDHIMQGTTVVIIPPSGDMSDYVASLHHLLTYDIHRLAPAHGHLIADAPGVVQEIIDHRMARENKVVAGLKNNPNVSINELLTQVYADVNPGLHRFAKMSLWAHLLKLEKERKAVKQGDSNLDFTDLLWSLTGK